MLCLLSFHALMWYDIFRSFQDLKLGVWCLHCPSWHAPRDYRVWGKWLALISKVQLAQCSCPLWVFFVIPQRSFLHLEASRNFLRGSVSWHLPWCWGQVVCPLCCFLLGDHLAQVLDWMRLWRSFRFHDGLLDCNGHKGESTILPCIVLEVPAGELLWVLPVTFLLHLQR